MIFEKYLIFGWALYQCGRLSVNSSTVRRSRHKVSGIQGIGRLLGSPAYRLRQKTRYKALYFQAFPLKAAYTPSTRATTPFQGFSPVLTRGSSLRSPIIVARLASERCSCSTNSAITLEDLLIPCECLIAPLYVDLGSTTQSYRVLQRASALHSHPVDHQGSKCPVFPILYAAISVQLVLSLSYIAV